MEQWSILRFKREMRFCDVRGCGILTRYVIILDAHTCAYICEACLHTLQEQLQGDESRGWLIATYEPIEREIEDASHKG